MFQRPGEDIYPVQKCKDGSIVLVTIRKKRNVGKKVSVYSRGWGSSQVTITHDALDITVDLPTPPPHPRHGTGPG